MQTIPLIRHECSNSNDNGGGNGGGNSQQGWVQFKYVLDTFTAYTEKSKHDAKPTADLSKCNRRKLRFKSANKRNTVACVAKTLATVSWVMNVINETNWSHSMGV